jgi:hypothetical protein
MEQDEEIGPYSHSTWFATKMSKICVGEKTASLTSNAGKTGCPHAEDWN